MSVKYKRDDFGNRMKTYENIGNSLKLIPNLPVIIRLDGNGFSKFTKKLKFKKPYDQELSQIMKDTTQYLVQNLNKCILGYTQSDEITLVLNDTYESPVDFDRRIQKLTSIIASKCSVYFYSKLLELKPDLDPSILPVFDCRIFNVPNFIEASNTILWREFDATKNSIQSVGQYYIGHRDMIGLDCKTVQNKLLTKYNVNWNDYPDFFKKGSYFIRYKNEETGKTIFEELFIEPLNKYSLEDRLNILFKIQ